MTSRSWFTPLVTNIYTIPNARHQAHHPNKRYIPTKMPNTTRWWTSTFIIILGFPGNLKCVWGRNWIFREASSPLVGGRAVQSQHQVRPQLLWLKKIHNSTQGALNSVGKCECECSFKPQSCLNWLILCVCMWFHISRVCPVEGYSEDITIIIGALNILLPCLNWIKHSRKNVTPV